MRLACLGASIAATLLIGLWLLQEHFPRLSAYFALAAILSPHDFARGSPVLAHLVERGGPPRLTPTQWRQEYPPSNVSIVSIVNSGYQPWTEHLLKNVQALGLSPYLILYTLDPACHARLQARGIDVRFVPTSRHEASRQGSQSYNGSSEEVRYGTPQYHELVHQLPTVMLHLLRAGRSVLFIDADVTLLSNPLAYLAPPGADMYVQDDLREQEARFNGGFFFARASPRTAAVFEHMAAFIGAHPGTNNQPAYNHALMRNARRLRGIQVLDPAAFPNGRSFGGKPTSATRVVPVAVHHNFAMGAVTKLELARRQGLLVERADLASLLANFSAAQFAGGQMNPVRRRPNETKTDHRTRRSKFT